jgi:hypothetical protein
MKARQSAKIREIVPALVATGITKLDSQAQALGLARSTAWTTLSARHKSTGLSPTVIDRILASPRLPRSVREKIVEYVNEKATGLYGHNKAQRHRFIAGLAAKLAERQHVEKIVLLSLNSGFRKRPSRSPEPLRSTALHCSRESRYFST